MAEQFRLRNHRRIKTRCILYYLGEQVCGTGSVRDVSLAGWRVVGDHPVTEGASLSLRIFFPTSPEPIQIDSATVKWVRGREFGLSMGELPASAQAAIRNFLRVTLGAADVPPDDE